MNKEFTKLLLFIELIFLNYVKNTQLKSSIGLGFFENYHKDIKAICEKNEKDF